MSCLMVFKEASAQTVNVPGEGSQIAWDASSLQVIDSNGVAITTTTDSSGIASLSAVIVGCIPELRHVFPFDFVSF